MRTDTGTGVLVGAVVGTDVGICVGVGESGVALAMIVTDGTGLEVGAGVDFWVAAATTTETAVGVSVESGVGIGVSGDSITEVGLTVRSSMVADGEVGSGNCTVATSMDSTSL